MKPALSVVLFTVLSGAGLGALSLIALLDLLRVTGTAGRMAADPVLARAGLVALVLLAGGLFASTLHLANPRNAWRALSRVRSSWLSREAAAAMLLLPVAVLFIAAMHDGWPAGLRILLSCACILLAASTVFCTAMIYASLKPVRQWHTARVPVVFVAFAHASGGLLLIAMVRAYGEPATMLGLVVLLLLGIAAIAKLDYWNWTASGEGAATIEQAVGVRHGVRPGPAAGTATRAPSAIAARLLDPGHSRGTFLTREFGLTIEPAKRRRLRLVVWIGAFAVPLLWLVAGLADWRGGAIALAACMIGLVAERWLFFADARHTVRLYHGDAST